MPHSASRNTRKRRSMERRRTTRRRRQTKRRQTKRRQTKRQSGGGKRRRIQKPQNTNTRKSKSEILTHNHDVKQGTCAPITDHELATGEHFEHTCYDKNTLMILRDSWNRKYPDCEITSDDPVVVWQYLSHYMEKTCKIESCWLNQSFVKSGLKREALDKFFAPKQPLSWKKNPDEWLSSIDIKAVMHQYEKKYHCFKFIGPSPIDYDAKLDSTSCVCDELCNFNLEDYVKQKKFKIGVIFNLDPHNKGGSHWVAVFINIRSGEICFFDSFAHPPDPQIDKFMKNVIEQSKAVLKNWREGAYRNILSRDIQLKPLKYHYNKTRHQFSHTECGMYSMYFIINMLRKKATFESFQKKRVPDDLMYKLRNEYFDANHNES